MLTLGQLNVICPAIKGAYGTVIINVLNKVLPLYNMDTSDILEDFIPNLLVECAEFTKFSENLNYSSDALVKLFGRHRISVDDANKYGRTNTHSANQQMLANTLYGGEWGRVNLGNTSINDGWVFRGAGPIQGTGRGIITKFTAFYNAKNGTAFSAEQMVGMVRDNINLEMGIHFACWFFSIAKGLISLSIKDNFKELVLRINGGYNGMDFRTKYYDRARAVLNVA